MSKLKRLPWIDALNILACMGVLLLHCTHKEIHHFSGTDQFGFVYGVLSHSFFLWPVDVFFMITGFTIMRKNLLISEDGKGLKQYYLHRCSRILIPILFWDCFYGASYILFTHPIDWKIVFFNFILLDFNDFMWFLIPLLIIYVSLPWYNILVTQCSKSLLKWFLIIGFILIAISELINDCPNGGPKPLRNLFPLGANYLIMTAAGYYFGYYNLSRSKQNIIFILGIFSILFLLIIGLWLIPKNNQFAHKALLYLNLPCIILAITVFVFFKYRISYLLTDKSEKFYNFLKTWSNYTLGIYLIQFLWFRTIRLFLSEEHYYGLLIFILMYPSCLLSVLLIKKIPYLKRIV